MLPNRRATRFSRRSTFQKLFASLAMPLVYSAVSMDADVRIQVPPIWGTFRAQKTSAVEENWFFECDRDGSLTPPPDPRRRFAVADSVPQRIFTIVLRPQSASIIDLSDEPTYEASALFGQMEQLCRDGNRSLLLHGLVAMADSARPYPAGSGRSITLSLVTILTNKEMYVPLFQRNLEVLARYTRNYAHLPFEMIVCWGKMRQDDPPFEKAIKVPSEMLPYLRVIPLPYGFGSEFHPPVFPEYLARNVGIRRARGEFIVSMSADVCPHISVFDGILHQQFTHFSFIRCPRTEVDLAMTADQLCDIAAAVPHRFSQSLLTRDDFDDWVAGCGGDFQGCHFAMWTLVRGYPEGSWTLHVDTRFNAEIIAAHVTWVFRKTFTCEFHLRHAQVSQIGSDPIRIFKDTQKNRGEITEGTYDKRPNWGYALSADFPSIVF
jgi:hypothetical protein